MGTPTETVKVRSNFTKNPVLQITIPKFYASLLDVEAGNTIKFEAVQNSKGVWTLVVSKESK